MGKEPLEAPKSAERGKEQGEGHAVSGKVSSQMSSAEGKLHLPASGEKTLPKDAEHLVASPLFPSESKGREQITAKHNEIQAPKTAKLESTAAPVAAESSIQQPNQAQDQSDRKPLEQMLGMPLDDKAYKYAEDFITQYEDQQMKYPSMPPVFDQLPSIMKDYFDNQTQEALQNPNQTPDGGGS